MPEVGVEMWEQKTATFQRELMGASWVTVESWRDGWKDGGRG